MNSYEMFFYYIGLLSLSNVLIFLIKNIAHWMKTKTFLKDQKDFEISFLKEKNELLAKKIEQQNSEIEKLVELIYTNK